jgi:hypothetical protein
MVAVTYSGRQSAVPHVKHVCIAVQEALYDLQTLGVVGDGLQAITLGDLFPSQVDEGAPNVMHRIFKLANGSEHTWKMAVGAKTHGYKIGDPIVVVDELLIELRTRLAEGLANALRHNQHQAKTANNRQGMVDCTVWRVSIFANRAVVKCRVSSMRAARMRTVASKNSDCPWLAQCPAV